ncbi:hypothetical protein DUNSADRAFT_17873 [Dunaliella salina]|uniref:Uncharacterized protein n=1 Tax=Dunaliella salina TaxID=3046 RepID=A0ABQ7G0Y5_DUNSA|nr:hypothetical protein DUNSADRAFT_17873 [Dunaliella salina]|eukprot:KAF5828265.1 hypothetical protein DUNSADRAFT_17873 [Dunaliella salina]
MGNCASAEVSEAGGVVGARLKSGVNTSVVTDLPSFKPPTQPLGGQGSAVILDQCSRDGVQLLLSRTSSMPSAHNSSSPSSVGKHCPSSPTSHAGTPRCSSSTSSICKPHRSSLPTNFRQASKTFSHSSPNRKFLPTNFRQASKTFTHGSLLHSSASHSHTPASATSMAPSTPLESRATVSAFDAASRTSTEEPPGHLGFPGLSSDLRGCVGVGEGPQPSTGGAFFSPWSVEASFPGFLQSPFEQQWPAEGRTGSQNLSEDAACSLDAAPASPEDWRSVHMAMAVAAEQGEHVPLPSEDFDAEKMETCPTSPMSSVAKEVAHSAAKPCAYSSRCSIPCSSPDQGSFRPSHADRACTTPGSWNSPRSSDSARRSQVSNTFARLSNAFSRLFMDDQKQSHSPRMSGKPGHPQPQVKVTLPSSLGHVSISDPQEPLPTVLSSSLYLPCNKCSSSHSECSPLNIRAAAPTLHDTAAHTCALNAAQQQQGVARGCVHMHAHPVSLFGSASVW